MAQETIAVSDTQIQKLEDSHEALARHFLAFVGAQDAETLWPLFRLTHDTFAQAMGKMKADILALRDPAQNETKLAA